MKLKKTLNIIFTSLMAIYPTFVFFALTFTNISLEFIAICMLIVCGIAFLLNLKTSNRYTPLFACIIAVFMLFTNAEMVLKFYPIGIVFLVLWAFGVTLFQKNTIVFGFATVADKTILSHPGVEDIKLYCRRVTQVWCAWFIVNILIDFYFVFFGDFDKWTFFNGPICWIVQVVLFVGEFIFRYFAMCRINRKYDLPRPGFFDMFKNMFKRRKKRQAEENVPGGDAQGDKSADGMSESAEPSNSSAVKFGACPDVADNTATGGSTGIKGKKPEKGESK